MSQSLALKTTTITNKWLVWFSFPPHGRSFQSLMWLYCPHTRLDIFSIYQYSRPSFPRNTERPSFPWDGGSLQGQQRSLLASLLSRLSQRVTETCDDHTMCKCPLAWSPADNRGKWSPQPFGESCSVSKAMCPEPPELGTVCFYLLLISLYHNSSECYSF